MDQGRWQNRHTQCAGTLRLMLHVALMAAGLFGALFLAWRIREALLLAFAAVVVAVILDAAIRPIQKRAGTSRSLALAAVGTGLLLVLAAFAWLLGAQIRAQVSSLSGYLPGSIEALEQMLGVQLLPRGDAQPGGAGGGGLSGIAATVRDIFGSLASLGSSLAGALSALVLVVVGGFFLAADPALYRRGLVKLFPRARHAQVEDALGTAGEALRLWLMAKVIAMGIVGVLAGFGAWLIGLPAPLALGLFAALTEFVPILGPLIGAIPALLLALVQGGSALAWTAVLFLALQQLESNVITPVIERRMVQIPPALMLFAVVAIGLVFGLAGVAVAAPLTVVLYVLVKKLYVRQTLGEATEVPGERESNSRSD